MGAGNLALEEVLFPVGSGRKVSGVRSTFRAADGREGELEDVQVLVTSQTC